VIPTYRSMILSYYKQHGLRAMVGRICERIWDRIAHAAFLVYVMECAKLDEADCTLPPGMTVMRRRSEAEMAGDEVEWLSDYYSPEIVKAQLETRFQRNASLWLARRDGKLVAHNWTVNGGPIESFVMPFTARDAYSFDAGTLKELRGQGIHTRFCKYVWYQLKKDGIARIYSAIREWNRPMLRQHKKMLVPFMGKAHQFRLFGRDFVIWSQMCHAMDKERLEVLDEGSPESTRIFSVARRGEHRRATRSRFGPLRE
jgi:hypothetical protein